MAEETDPGKDRLLPIDPQGPVWSRRESGRLRQRCVVKLVEQIGIPLVPRPLLPSFLCKYVGSSLALEMLRAGTATTYEESGAEYGPWGRDTFLRVEEEAR